MRQFDDPDNEAQLLHLPRVVMNIAGDMLRSGQEPPANPHMMREAAWLAGIALAIAIELRCPMRIKNLANLRYGVHVIKLDRRRETWTHLMVEVEETKNGVPIRWPVDIGLAGLIDEYTTKFRGLLRHSNSDFVFPNRDHPDQPRSKGGLGRAISEVIHRFHRHRAEHAQLPSVCRLATAEGQPRRDRRPAAYPGSLDDDHGPHLLPVASAAGGRAALQCAHECQ